MPTSVLHTISHPTSTNLARRRSTTAMIESTPQTGQIRLLHMLVTPSSLHTNIPCILRSAFFITLKPKEVYFQFKNLLLITTYFEFHPHSFCVKDQATRDTIFRGHCKLGLYPQPYNPNPSLKQAFGTIKLSYEDWYSRLEPKLV